MQSTRKKAYTILYVLLLIFFIIGCYMSYSYYVSKCITGVYELVDSSLNPPTITIHAENGKLKIVGVYPDKTGFLVYGSYPIYKTALYPIKSTTPAYYAKFMPFKQNNEYSIYISKAGSNDNYRYHKISEL